MIQNVAVNILKLIEENEGLEKDEVFTKPSIDVQKIIDIILSESKCSIIDSNGNYSRYGSSIDIRIVKNLIKIFLSNAKEIPPELVSMSLTKEEILGPFMKIGICKKRNLKTGIFEVQMEDIYPKNFHIENLESNIEVKNEFIDAIIKPYVKNIIFENDVLMKQCPVGSWLAKKTSKIKTNDELVQDMIDILKKILECNEKQIENVANYILINILQNKSFKEELVSNAINVTNLQMLGKIYTGFNGLVETMVNEVEKIIKLKEIPVDEYNSVKEVFYTSTAILIALSTNLESKSENEILEDIQKTNRNFNLGSNNKNEFRYRENELHVDKYENVIEFVSPNEIQDAMNKLCKMIKVLLDKKEEVGIETYLKEVIRIHYRFIRISPFERANGKTARSIVNMLLQSKELAGIFRKEKRKEYIESLSEAHKIIKKQENKYIENLSKNPMECIEVENEFLNKQLPFLLVKY